MELNKEEIEIIYRAMAVNEIQMNMDEMEPSLEFIQLRDKVKEQLRLYKTQSEHQNLLPNFNQ